MLVIKRIKRFAKLRITNLKIIQPKRGDKVNLVDMAKTNAEHHLAELLRREKIAIGNNAVNELKSILGLKKLPVVIEGYDIANIQGKSAVGSQVCFKDGRPFKKGYRIYKIKTKDTPDDYMMMEEVLTRRLNRWEDDEFAEKRISRGTSNCLTMIIAACLAVRQRVYSSPILIMMTHNRRARFVPAGS